MEIEQIRQKFIKKVKSLDIVRDVLIEGDTITTVIEAPPWDDNFRMPILDAELEAYWQMGPNDILDFHIHNILEDNV